MNYFDSDLSNSTNMVVYFDWKAVIYIYVCGHVVHNLCCPIRADDNTSTCIPCLNVCTGACANEIIPNR